jgi:hypothetical protein
MFSLENMCSVTNGNCGLRQDLLNIAGRALYRLQNEEFYAFQSYFISLRNICQRNSTSECFSELSNENLRFFLNQASLKPITPAKDEFFSDVIAETILDFISGIKILNSANFAF